MVVDDGFVTFVLFELSQLCSVEVLRFVNCFVFMCHMILLGGAEWGMGGCLLWVFGLCDVCLELAIFRDDSLLR